MQSGHVRLTLQTTGNGSMRGIAFRAAESPLGAFLLGARGGQIHLAGKLKPGWRGGAPELQIEDAAPL